jgi:hypothetical protein
MVRLADARPGLTHIPNRMKNVPSLLASDGFHPGVEFYRQWGEGTARHIVETFKPASRVSTSPVSTSP